MAKKQPLYPHVPKRQKMPIAIASEEKYPVSMKVDIKTPMTWSQYNQLEKDLRSFFEQRSLQPYFVQYSWGPLEE